MIKGFVNINKPIGMTSSNAVVKVRGILSRAVGEKVKVGHLGTLDPLAEGVLPVAVGTAARLFDYLQTKIKKYVAAFRFGVLTDTLDKGGQIIKTDNKDVSIEKIRSVIPELIGSIAQVPPQYSAKSVGGKRAYDIARSGGFAELKPKTVNIFDIKPLSNSEFGAYYQDGSLCLDKNEFAFEITCGGGTYIRAIARDMAEKLSTVGIMSSLIRTKSGEFELSDAVSFDEFEAEPLKYLLPIEFALKDFDSVNISGEQAFRALNGVHFELNCNAANPFAVYNDGALCGMGENINGRLYLKCRL